MDSSLRIAMIVFLGMAVAPAVQAGCNGTIPLTRPDARYVDNQDGTVTDTVTGLMWMQCAQGMHSGTTACDSGRAATFTWPQALQHAAEVNAAQGGEPHGYHDWRVPDLKELKSLSELACTHPAINTHLFPNTPSGLFWSATPVASLAGQAWSVGFFYGGDRWGSQDDMRYLRLVRKAH